MPQFSQLSPPLFSILPFRSTLDFHVLIFFLLFYSVQTVALLLRGVALVLISEDNVAMLLLLLLQIDSRNRQLA